MIVQCHKCNVYFEDEYRSYVCPHSTFPANDGNNNFSVHEDSYLSKHAPVELSSIQSGKGFLVSLVILITSLLLTSCATCSEKHPCKHTSNSYNSPINGYKHKPEPISPLSNIKCLLSCSDLFCSYKAKDGGLIYTGYTNNVKVCK